MIDLLYWALKGRIDESWEYVGCIRSAEIWSKTTDDKIIYTGLNHFQEMIYIIEYNADGSPETVIDMSDDKDNHWCDVFIYDMMHNNFMDCDDPCRRFNIPQGKPVIIN